MSELVIGTAGHVDHGKTWLTRALTGIDTDRLKEERERGITVDLGFARLELPDGQVASVVDVPGHERLVRNMIAGATGMDLVLMVVAADEGFMPQTQEHLQILQLLGVRRGVLVLSKCDAVDAGWADAVEADLRERVRGSFLEGAPCVRCSAVTGEGLDELRDVISRLAEGPGSRGSIRRDPDRACRLPIDRSFTKAGFGTVVTGSLVDGRIRVGEELELYPGHARVRVRGLQSNGAAVGEAVAGMRVAANLAGVERSEVGRGDVLALPGTVELADRVTVELEVTGDARFSLRNSSSLHLFCGTQELVGRLRLLDADELLPGERGFAQLSPQGTLAARANDRFVVRFFSPMVTVGGGRILELGSPRHKRHRPEVLVRLARLAGTPEEALAQRVDDAGLALPGEGRLAVAQNLSLREAGRIAGRLVDSGACVRVGGGLASASRARVLADEVRELLGEHQDGHPLERGMGLGELRERALASCPSVADAWLCWLADEGVLELGEGRAWLPGFEPHLDGRQLALRGRLLEVLGERGLRATSRDKLAEETGAPEPELAALLAHMEGEGALVELPGGWLVLASAYEEARAALGELFASGAPVTLAQFRDRLGISRRYAQMLLEAFDHAGVSRLAGEARVPVGGRG